jgi:hypothetical protein
MDGCYWRIIEVDRAKIESIIRENGYEKYNTRECKSPR